MAFCCSKCNFTAQFESALTMHHQLHHETPTKCVQDNMKNISERAENSYLDKSKTIPRPLDMSPSSTFFRKDKDLKVLAARITPSATKFFSRIKSRICRSKTTISVFDEEQALNDISTRSECTSKAMKGESSSLIMDGIKEREVYSCHLCDFDADRITVLDRHLLTDHKLTLESLLQLVMCKTKEGLNADPCVTSNGSRQPYYRPADTIISNGDCYIETVMPKIKVLKNTAVNTDLTWLDRPEFPDASDHSINSKMKTTSSTQDSKEDVEMNLLQKMASLNEFMCKFVESSNTLKRALSRDEGKWRRGSSSCHVDDTPREWASAHSERTDRHRRRRHDWPFHLNLDQSPRERALSERSERHRSKVKHRARREPTTPLHLQLDE